MIRSDEEVKNMCGFMKPRKPKQVTFAPAATVMNSDVSDTSAQTAANERERKKRGYNSTRSGMANILAGVNNQKGTLG